MRQFLLASALLTGLLAVSATAHAEAVTTLDFSNIPVGSTLSGSTPGVFFTQNGYRFDYSGGQDVTFVNFASSRVAQGGANTLSIGAGITVSRIDGKPFTLYSFDSANLVNGTPAFPLFVASSTGASYRYPMTSPTLTTVDTSTQFIDVTSAAFSLLNLPTQGENLVVTNLVVSAIPEPAALPALAPAALLLARRRR
jgi:hypothetical protein